MMTTPTSFDYVWHWLVLLPERKGQRCRILARGALNSICVEFEDGEKHIVSRYAVRRIKENESDASKGSAPKAARSR